MTETAESSKLESTKPGRVFLVVDDDPMVRKIVSRGLATMEPAEIIEREDGLEAQALLLERSVDVVITDVMMPNMDGLSLMKWAQENNRDALWIVLSGVETFDAAVEALQLGAFDYLAKPPEIPRVRVAVRNALDQIELVSERERLYGELEDSNQQLAEKVNQLQTVCHVLEDQAATIQADLDRAEIIQRALLPRHAPETPGWCLETLYRPGSSVGGDFYDVRVLDERYLGVVIADAAGHGVAAAMLSVLFKLRLRHKDKSGAIRSPAGVLAQLNSSLFDMLSAPGSFITASYILVDLESGEGRIASAGHTPCLLRTRSGDALTLSRTGPALGLEEQPSYEEHSFSMTSGDRLLLYTDGLIDGGPHCPDQNALQHALARDESRNQILESLFEDAIRDLEGDRDDVMMLLLERSDEESHLDNSLPTRVQRSAAAPTSPASTGGPAEPDHAHVAEGDDGERGYIAVVGSVTWLCAQALLDAANQLLAERGQLIIALDRCEHLDSTCLGTLHEIVVSHPRQVQILGTSDAVQQLFDELSMTAVLEQMGSDAMELPSPMHIIETAALSPQQQGARILSAHETLAALSDANEDQFRAVVDSLRADMPT